MSKLHISNPVFKTGLTTGIKYNITLGMPELGLNGLSENWLLKTLGHYHWRLIGNALGQPEASFKDDKGNEVYAAFCGLSINSPHLDLAHLDKVLTVKSNLYRVSAARLASHHYLIIDNQTIGEVTLVSTFVSRHGKQKNHHIARLHLPLPHMLPVLPHNISFPHIAAKIAKNTLKTHQGLKIDETQNSAIKGTFTPCPSLDFNRVGLLYFPTYIMAAERFLSDVTEQDLTHKTIKRRDAVFLSNIDIGEKLCLELKDSVTGQNAIKNYVFIKSCSGKPLAKILSLYG